MSFCEYTAISTYEYGEETCEFYIHFNEKGKLIHAYCWKDAVPEFIARDNIGEPLYDRYGDYKIVPIKIKQSKNPLFLHLSVSQLIKHLGSIYIIPNYNEDGTEKDDEYLNAAFNMYPNLHSLEN